MMVNFGNRYTVLANLIRHLHDEVIRDNISPTDAERFLDQINQLRDRLRLIGIIQSLAAISFVFALVAMIAAYFDNQITASYLFLSSIFLQMQLKLVGQEFLVLIRSLSTSTESFIIHSTL